MEVLLPRQRIHHLLRRVLLRLRLRLGLGLGFPYWTSPHLVDLWDERAFLRLAINHHDDAMARNIRWMSNYEVVFYIFRR